MEGIWELGLINPTGKEKIDSWENEIRGSRPPCMIVPRSEECTNDKAGKYLQSRGVTKSSKELSSKA